MENPNIVGADASCSKIPSSGPEDVKPYGVIYKFTHKESKRIYIGQAKDMKKRIRTHKDQVDRGDSDHFHCALRKYGFEAFSLEIIDKCYSQEDMNEKEQQYISIFDTMDQEIGYNLRSGGGQNSLSQESKDKISRSHKEGHDSGRIVYYWKGRVMTEESRTKIAATRREKYGSEKKMKKKTRTHESQFKKGVSASPATQFPSSSIKCVETQVIYPTVTSAAKTLGVGTGNFARLWRNPDATVCGFHWIKVSTQGVSTTNSY